MMPQSISPLTDALFIVPIRDFPLDQVVGKKLDYYLKNQLPIKDIFSQFYLPVEQAVIESCLDLFRGNQSRVAQCLEINRNTLKKKIDLHKINIKSLLEKNFISSFLKQDLYVNNITGLDLLEISRLKISLLKPTFSDSNPLKTICRPVEQKIIKTSLAFFKDNHLRTALFLKISRNTLKKRLDFNNHHLRG